ncbi:MAG: hypothetical protein GIW94_08640 [Candidatus Eremiobacteraeota bacterium]|nr:hypothetical protein [Candidatus Eremiobacteraeota bacterium]MBC5821279.1 hypothetical protein [Candidatus Eremiobacteraeota bacterium]
MNTRPRLNFFRFGTYDHDRLEREFDLRESTALPQLTNAIDHATASLEAIAEIFNRAKLSEKLSDTPLRPTVEWLRRLRTEYGAS